MAKVILRCTVSKTKKRNYLVNSSNKLSNSKFLFSYTQIHNSSISLCICGLEVHVCVCVCMCGFCNVCVCEGFVMCGCFGNLYTVL